VSGTPAIGVDGTVYFTSDSGDLHAVAATGEMRWKVPLPQQSGSPSASPLLGDDGRLYVGDTDDRFHAFSAAGEERWSWTCPNGCAFWSPPAQGSDGTVYVGSSDAELLAFATDGQVRWRFEVDNTIHGAPAVGEGDVVYVAAGIAHQHDTLYAVRASGSSLWTAVLTESSLSSVSPSIGADGTVYAAFDDGTMRAFTTGGSPKWTFRTGSPYQTAAAIGADGTLYFGTNDRSLYAVSSAGEQRWTFATGGEIVSAPAIGADGTLYFGSRDRFVYALRW
jgi:outer membrane protein assembly factor BamB